MYCIACGKELGDTARFCKYCGTKVPIIDDTANHADAGNQPSRPPAGAGDAPHVTMPNIKMPQIPTGAFTENENVKKALSSKECTDSRLNILFGGGHAILIVLTFLPWYKAGLTDFNPYAIISQITKGISQGAGGTYIIVSVLLIVAMIILTLPNVYGAYMRFAKSRTVNIGFFSSILACALYFVGMQVLAMSGQAPAGAAMNPVYGFYITFVLAVVLAILGSGRINMQKYLGGANAPKQ